MELVYAPHSEFQRVIEARVAPELRAEAFAALPPGNYPLAIATNSQQSKPQFMQVTVAGLN